MEYLEGETLEDRLSRGALPIDDVIALGGQIAEAVAAAHRAGVVHRDLKPGNVMLTRDGVKVLDFGLAKALETRAAGAGSDAPTVTGPLTSDGSIMGTLLYMAPEQLEGKEADARSDLWALGAVLYQMVTGARPFEGESRASLMAAIMTGRPRAVSELVPSVPARLEWLIARCLEKSPDRRWQSARDLALELGSLGEVSESPLPGATGGRRRRAIAVALGVAAAMLAGLGIGRLLPFGASDRTGVAEPERWTTTVLDSASSDVRRLRTDSGWSHLRSWQRSRTASADGTGALSTRSRRYPCDDTRLRDRSVLPRQPAGRDRRCPSNLADDADRGRRAGFPPRRERAPCRRLE